MTIETRPELLPQEKYAAKEQIGQLLNFARGLIVQDESAFRSITEVYAKAREMEKLVGARLKEANRQFQEQLNANKDLADEFLGPLKEIIATCNTQTNNYRQMLLESKAKEEALVKSAAAVFDAPMPYIAPVERSIKGSGATSVTKKKKRFAVEDLSKVPLRYLRLNEDAVEMDLKLGLGAIAGLRIWEESVTELRAR